MVILEVVCDDTRIGISSPIHVRVLQHVYTAPVGEHHIPFEREMVKRSRDEENTLGDVADQEGGRTVFLVGNKKL